MRIVFLFSSALPVPNPPRRKEEDKIGKRCRRHLPLPLNCPRKIGLRRCRTGEQLVQGRWQAKINLPNLPYNLRVHRWQARRRTRQVSLSLSLSLYSLSLSLSLSVSVSVTRSLAHSLTHSLTLSLTHTLSLSRSLSLRHTPCDVRPPGPPAPCQCAHRYIHTHTSFPSSSLASLLPCMQLRQKKFRQTFQLQTTRLLHSLARARALPLSRALSLYRRDAAWARQARWGDRRRESGKATVFLTFLVLFLQRQRRKEVWASKEEKEGFDSWEEEGGLLKASCE